MNRNLCYKEPPFLNSAYALFSYRRWRSWWGWIWRRLLHWLLLIYRLFAMPAFVQALFIKSSTEVELSYCTKKQAHQVSLLHVPAALWNGLFYVLNSANKDKVWQNFEFFLSFLTKIHAVLNGLKRSKAAFLPCFFHQKCTKKPLKHWILAVFQVWTWGESNPCPKAYSFRHLPLQSFY